MPSCDQNAASSVTSTARTSVGLMREYGTHRWDWRTGLPAARASSARSRMNAVDAGRSVRSRRTSGSVTQV